MCSRKIISKRSKIQNKNREENKKLDKIIEKNNQTGQKKAENPRNEENILPAEDLPKTDGDEAEKVYYYSNCSLLSTRNFPEKDDC